MKIKLVIFFVLSTCIVAASSRWVQLARTIKNNSIMNPFKKNVEYQAENEILKKITEEESNNLRKIWNNERTLFTDKSIPWYKKIGQLFTKPEVGIKARFANLKNRTHDHEILNASGQPEHQIVEGRFKQDLAEMIKPKSIGKMLAGLGITAGLSNWILKEDALLKEKQLEEHAAKSEYSYQKMLTKEALAENSQGESLDITAQKVYDALQARKHWLEHMIMQHEIASQMTSDPQDLQAIVHDLKNQKLSINSLIQRLPNEYEKMKVQQEKNVNNYVNNYQNLSDLTGISLKDLTNSLNKKYSLGA